MAHYKRMKVLSQMAETGLVPLFYHADVEIGKEVLKACYRGGARTIEFTNRGDFAHEVFGALNKFAVQSLPGLILGVGSITDAATASIYMQLGANFIVSASLREDVALNCNRRKVPYMPGCGTLTEIGKAEELGCEIVKLFPGSVYGPGFIKAIKGPQPWTSIMPTGGVSPERENLTRWFQAGAHCVGMGSKLISKNADGQYDLPRIEEMTRESLAMIQEIRG
jgi:2-dehydro-3-deoxyphosphogluconate aldolase/(4S)-4-hydroxy-2-oxoglutarate aldolase